MKPKAQTLSQRFGFLDPELTTPSHDAIMLWLDAEIDQVINCHNPGWSITPKIKYRNIANPYYRTPDHITSEAKDRSYRMKEQIITELSLTEMPQPIIRKVWESPIIDRTYTIGFCDMLVYWSFPCLECLFNVTDDNNGRTEWEYAGAAVHKPDYFLQNDRAYFEVKPSIPSLGEVIRQIRMYQTYTRNGTPEWWVVSPDTRFKSQIEAQGIKFLAVPAGVC